MKKSLVGLIVVLASSQVLAQIQAPDCNGAPATQMDGVWKSPVIRQGEFEFQGKLTFAGQTLTATNHCTMGDLVLDVSAGPVTAQYGTGTLTIMGNAQREAEISRGGRTLKCNVELQPMTMQHSFRGSCLVLSAQGQEMVLEAVR